MSDLQQMGREVVAVTGWLPGMLARGCGLSDDPEYDPWAYTHRCRTHWRGHVTCGQHTDGRPADNSYHPDTCPHGNVPDLTDPATQGCVMGWLRGQHPGAYLIPRKIDWAVLWRPEGGLRLLGHGKAIPEALHAAVMALGGEVDDAP